MDGLHVLATLVLGLFAGSLLMEGALLVPYWRTLSSSEFFGRHGEFGPRLYRYFFPLTNAAVWLACLSAGFSGLANGYRNAAAVLCLCAVATFFLFFKQANAAFAARALSDAELPRALTRWAAWHWARTAAASDEGSLAGAARALALSAPSVTRVLGDLESELGVLLFHRTTRALTLCMSTRITPITLSIWWKSDTTSQSAWGRWKTPAWWQPTSARCAA